MNACFPQTFLKLPANLRPRYRRIGENTCVINAGATSQLPLKPGDGSATLYWIAGQPQESIRGQVALIRLVTRDYFPTIGARLGEGRFFELLILHADCHSSAASDIFLSGSSALESVPSFRLASHWNRTSRSGSFRIGQF
jgi:hypothetical protein